MNIYNITAVCDRIVKPAALNYISAGQHIFANHTCALSYAECIRTFEQTGVFKSGYVILQTRNIYFKYPQTTLSMPARSGMISVFSKFSSINTRTFSASPQPTSNAAKPPSLRHEGAFFIIFS